MVPVLAVGFDTLNARVEAQSGQATAQQEKLKVTLLCRAVRHDPDFVTRNSKGDYRPLQRLIRILRCPDFIALYLNIHNCLSDFSDWSNIYTS